jgi:hypothetical protein
MDRFDASFVLMVQLTLEQAILQTIVLGARVYLRTHGAEKGRLKFTGWSLSVARNNKTRVSRKRF